MRLGTVVGSHTGHALAQREEEGEVWRSLVARFADDIPPSPFTLPITAAPAPPLFDPTMSDRDAVRYLARICISVSKKLGHKPAYEMFRAERSVKFRTAALKARASMQTHAVPPAAFVHFAFQLWAEWREAGYVKGTTPHYAWLLDTKRLEEQRWMFSKERSHYTRTPAIFAPDRYAYAREWVTWRRLVILRAPETHAEFLSTVRAVFGVDNLKLRAHAITVAEAKAREDFVARMRAGEFVW